MGGRNTCETTVNKSKIADGRRLEKSKIGHVSATVWLIHMKFGMMTHIGHLNCTGKLDGCIVLNEHNTVLGSNRLAICATVYVGVQR